MMKHQQTELLATAPIGRLFLRLTIPGIVAQLVFLLNNVIDRMWVGHIENTGSLALTAVGVCMPIVQTFLALAVMIGSGAGPRLSILLGKNNQEGAERTIGTSLWFVIVSSVASMALIFLFTEPLIRLFGGSEKTMDYAASYLTTTGWGFIFLAISAGMVPLIYAQGMIKEGVLCSIIPLLIHMLLDPVLIFLLDMGITGAALAQNIGMLIGTALILRLLCGKAVAAPLQLGFIRFSAVWLPPCITLGLSALAALACESIALMLYNRALLALDGDVAVGAMTVFTVVVSIIAMMLLGVSTGAQPILSFNYGARLKPRVLQAMKVTMWICTAISFVIWLTVMLFPAAIINAFTDDANLVAYGTRYARTFFALAFLIGANYGVQYILKSLGLAWSSLTLGLLRRVVLLIPLLMLMPRLFAENGSMAVFMTAPVIELLTLIISLCYYLRIRRQIIKETI